MYRKALLFLLVLCCVSMRVAAIENNDSILVFGRVMNNITYEIIKDVRVDIMTPDSTLIDTLRTKPFLFNGEEMNVYRVGGLRLPRNKDFIFRFTRKDYETTYLNCNTTAGQRERRLRIKDVLMQKKWEVNLNEFAVTATKIKMVMKGDTIEYNADAFQLSNGSMLDALISQLPGVQLDGSRITVNGRFVSSLLINGENFFRGDAAVALKNLPAYWVDKVKVYEKAPEYEYITGRDETRELPLVVDVNLKKQYNVGWLANAEMGSGTHGRWLGRLFGLRFSDCTRLALFGNINNINDTHEPGTSGNWNASWAASGLTTMKLGGAELLVKDKKHVWKYTGNVKALREDIDEIQKRSSENFLQTGNTYGRSSYRAETGSTKIMSQHTVELNYSNASITLKTYGEFADSRSNKNILQAEFSQPLYESYSCASLDSLYGNIYKPYCEALLLNYNCNDGLEKNSYFKGNAVANAFVSIPGSDDYMRINAGGNYYKSSYDVFSHYLLRLPNALSDGTTFLNRYGDNPKTDYCLYANIDYTYRGTIGEHSLRIVPAYNYKYTHTNDLLNYYLLNKIAGWSGGANLPSLGELPSSVEELYKALDAQNCYYSTLQKSVHTPQVRVVYFLFNNKHNIAITPKWRIERDRLEYRRAAIDTIFSRTTVVFEPSVRYSFDDFGLEYSMTLEEPSMVSLLNVRNESNPLLVREGNSRLKKTRIHKVNIHRYFWNRATHYNLSLKGYYNLYEDAVAQSLLYEAKTGVRTYRPQNISGNWQAGGSVDFSRAVDENQRFFISVNNAMVYHNSADYIAIDGATESVRSSVRNFSLSQSVQGKYTEGGNNITLKATARWNRVTSNRIGFEKISCVDFNYGVSGFWSLPLKIKLASDFTVYSRRGYNDALMNDNEIVWNARLERAFLSGGNLVFAIEGFDILGQMSNVQRSLNAQGRVETRYNTIPRYAMLRVIYRLNVEPKKSKQ